MCIRDSGVEVDAAQVSNIAQDKAFAQHTPQQNNGPRRRRLHQPFLQLRVKMKLGQGGAEARGLACEQNGGLARMVQLDNAGGDLLGLAAKAGAGRKAARQRRVAACALAAHIAVAQNSRAAGGQGLAQFIGAEIAALEVTRQLAGALQFSAQRLGLLLQLCLLYTSRCV